MEELRDVFGGLALADDSGTCSWILHWGEVRDLVISHVSTTVADTVVAGNW